MKRLRNSVLMSTAVGAILAVPGVALAQETCIQVLGTINTEVGTAGQSQESQAQASGLILGARSADEAGGAACIESLDELRAMLQPQGAVAAEATTEEPMEDEQAADATAEEPLEGEQAADATAEEPMEGEQAADATAEEPLEGEQAADATAEEPMEGEQTADATAEEPLEGEETAEGALEEPEELAAVEPAAGAEAGAEAEIEAEAEVADVGDATEVLREHTAGELEGADVISPEGGDIGNIEYFVTDAEGQVHAVISLNDGILGMGASERVVSMDSFDYFVEEEDFILIKMSEEWLESLPEFDEEAGYVEIEDETYLFQ